MKEPTYTEILLERLKFGMVTRLARDFAIAPRVDVSKEIDFMADMLAVRVRQDVLAQKLDKIESKWPTDWWQAVKERFAPQWFTRRYPVLYHHRILEAHALYPMIALPDERHSLRIAVQSWSDSVDR